jgi:hypothetical protein
MDCRSRHEMFTIFFGLSATSSRVALPRRDRFANWVLIMVPWVHFLGGKASWSITSGTVPFSSFSPYARCYSWRRRILRIVRAKGPPRFMRRPNCRARVTARLNPIKARENWRNWPSPRENPFASCISHEPAFMMARLVPERPSYPIGSVPRLFRNTPSRFSTGSQRSLCLREHERGFL